MNSDEGFDLHNRFQEEIEQFIQKQKHNTQITNNVSMYL